jgi:hypothetical protein
MTKNYILITLLLLTIAFSSCKITQRVAKEHQKFFPEEIKAVYLGMNLNQLKAIRNKNNLSIDPGSQVTYAFEKFSNKDYTQINYQFDNNNILYEVIISYREELNIFDKFEEKYGQSNSRKEWIFENIDGINIKIWVFNNRLCIANQKYFD